MLCNLHAQVCITERRLLTPKSSSLPFPPCWLSNTNNGRTVITQFYGRRQRFCTPFLSHAFLLSLPTCLLLFWSLLFSLYNKGMKSNVQMKPLLLFFSWFWSIRLNSLRGSWLISPFCHYSECFLGGKKQLLVIKIEITHQYLWDQNDPH